MPLRPERNLPTFLVFAGRSGGTFHRAHLRLPPAAARSHRPGHRQANSHESLHHSPDKSTDAADVHLPVEGPPAIRPPDVAADWDRRLPKPLHNRGTWSGGDRSHCGTLQADRAFADVLRGRVERRVSCHSTSVLGGAAYSEDRSMAAASCCATIAVFVPEAVQPRSAIC